MSKLAHGAAQAAAAHACLHPLRFGDLAGALAAGWADFRAHPRFGLFFGTIYLAGGWAIWLALAGHGGAAWLIPIAGGFPLVTPLVAAGLYEVSRRREAGLPLSWRAVLGALRGHDDDQILLMAGLIFVGFTFWVILAHSIFAIFLSGSGMGSESVAFLRSPSGMGMLAVGGAVGALLGLAFYATTVISLPMLVDRETDFFTAIITSLRVVRANRPVIYGWAVLSVLALAGAMVPLFLGLPIVLPVLGHATWHLYRRAVDPVAA